MLSLRTSAAALVWQSPGRSEDQFRTCRGRCPYRPKAKNCAYFPTLKECSSAEPSGGNFLVPARKLIRSRLKGRCRKAAPLRIPRPHRQRQIVKDFFIKFTKNPQKRCQKHRMAPDTSFDRLHFSVQQVFAEIRIVWQLVDIWLPAPLDFGQFQRIGCFQCMIVACHI